MISVIVPVYNVEKYLDDCIQSILSQRILDFELVLVDDGSTDKSYEICEKYATRDKRVKFVSITNSGVNHARKVGVENAIGEYTMFVDSDDTIDCYALENMTRAITRLDDVDIVVGHMQDEYKVVSGSEYLIDMLNSTCNVAMSFKLYKTNVLQKCFIDIPRRFKYGEDLLQNINLAQYVNKVVYCDIKYYNYRSVETSISHTFQFNQEYEKKYYNFLSSLLFEGCFLNKQTDNIKSEICMALYRSHMNGLKNIALYSHVFNFNDPDFIRLKSEVKPFSQRLSIDEKILLYTPSRMCIMLLKLYYVFCRFKQNVKKVIYRM